MSPTTDALLKSIQFALEAFTSQALPNATVGLFQTLGYNTSRDLTLSQDTYAGFEQDFDLTTSGFRPDKARAAEWGAIHLLFQITDAEMQATGQLFERTVEREDPDSYLFFAIDLTGSSYTKPQLAEIVREVNKPFPMHVFVLFRYGGCLTLSLIQRRPNRRFMDRDVLETVTHVHGIHPAKPHTAHVRILRMFSLDSIRVEAPGKRLNTFRDLQSGWRKVMRTDVLNQQFYREYSELSKKLIRMLYPVQVASKLDAHQGVLNLLNRVMFVYFVQKKGWLMEDEAFIYHFWKDYKVHSASLRPAEAAKISFHEHWLNPVFFAAFNNKLYTPEGVRGLSHIAEPYKSELVKFPFLNGGLFAQHATYDQFLLPDAAFEAIFTYFESYLFTIQEDTPLDVTLEINPELLGKMYEGMINATDLDDVDAEHGIVYTERPEINFMVRRSLVEVLDQKLNPNLPPDRPHDAPRPGYSREFLYHFIFDKPEQQLALLARQAELAPAHFSVDALREAITTFTACDPSCGSGSMLLGVIQVQMELLRTIDNYLKRPHSGIDDYNIKKQLISVCIYGVDIKEWAVRIAELRLWLYMITEAEFTAEQLQKAPLLPNLDFKLRQGNSLLQKFGNLDFTVADLMRSRKGNTSAKRKLREFIQAKKAFVTGSDPDSRTTASELKKQELDVFAAFLTELIEANDKRVQQLGVQQRTQQGALFNTGRGQQANLPLDLAEITAIRADTTKLRQLLTQLRVQGRLPFSYDIDFMEVFLAPDEEADRGFDLVIGNPPYVSQVAMLPPEDGQRLEFLLRPENATQKKLANKALKEELNSKVYKTYPFLAAQRRVPVLTADGEPELDKRNNPISKLQPIYGKTVPGRSDLYCYFQILAPSYLNQHGTFCFIISSSWLDAEFGAYVQQFLLKHTRLLAIYDCNIRSFDAAVNTVIYLHSAPLQISSSLNDGFRGVDSATHSPLDFRTLNAPSSLTRFVHNKVDYSLAAYAPLLLEQENLSTNTFKTYYRLIPLSQEKLLEISKDEDTSEYGNGKWGGKYMQAPEVLYRIIELSQLNGTLGTFGHHFTGERYLNTGGADGFFLITDYSEDEDYYYIINDKSTNGNSFQGKLEKELLKPLIKDATKKDKRITIAKPDALCLVVPPGKPAKNLARYIDWGEEQGYHERSVTSMQTPWYKPTNQMLRGASVLVPRSFGDAFTIHYNPKKHLSLRFYRLHFKNKEDLGLVAYLNSTMVTFFQETFGNRTLGLGALDFFMADFLAMQIPIISVPTSGISKTFLTRQIGSIFTELGFDVTQPIREQKPAPLPDRAIIDKIVFDALGLTDVERGEIYWSVAELVQQRINKAASR